MNPKRAIVSVINDLSTDQRVNRTCVTLVKEGYDVLLVGRKMHNSLPLEPRVYKTHRMNLLFETGPLFYAEYTIRLFFFLLFRKAHLLFSNDLDTLKANYLISKVKGCKLIYDTHEYFTEVPELQHAPFKKKIWKALENFVFPKLKHVITVNGSIAKLYSEEYGVPVDVVRNIPSGNTNINPLSRADLGLPIDKKIIILQGAGINIQRGAEEAVTAMQYVNGAILLIIGGGDVIDILKKMVRDLKLEEKVKFISKQPFEKLIQYTRNADIGLTLDKDTNINYRYSLPNKLFDYIHAGIPVLASPLMEVKQIIEKYNIGTLIDNHNPQHIADKLNYMLSDQKQLNIWQENTRIAAEDLTWEKEKKTLIEIINKS